MVRRIVKKVKPSRGFAHFLHLGLVVLIPPLVYVFVRLDLFGVALAVVLLSKWRIFAIRPRHWLAHLRTNAVDIIFSLSILAFMINSTAMSVQLLWVLVYEIWIIFIKPGSKPLMVTAQALLAQLAGMTAIFIAFSEQSLGLLMLMGAVIMYFSARHFFGIFEEVNFQIYSWLWALFGVSLIWILGHWSLFYGPVSQIAVIVSVVGYGLAMLYYLSETDKLSKLVQRQVLFVMIGLIAVMLILGDWGASNF